MTKDLKIEPKIGEIITVKGVKYITQLSANCSECALKNKGCWNIVCNPASRKDGQNVIFKEVKNTMEVKIQIPDNCELIKDGDTYVVKEKNQEPPKSWEEFCERYPISKEEYAIDECSSIIKITELDDTARNPYSDKAVCTSKEEAEAFLALMQLRQLRKAWIGDWKITQGKYAACITQGSNGLVIVDGNFISTRIMMFPNTQMAAEFLICFKDLLEKAKVLL